MVVGNRPAAAIAQPGSADFLTPDPRGHLWTGIDPHQTGTIAAVQTHAMPFSSTLERMRTLSSKIIAIQMLFLTVALLSIGITFLVSWELEGGAAAINDAGSLRMRAYRLAYTLADNNTGLPEGARAALGAEVREFEAVLATLRQGDPARPLFMPSERRVVELFATVESQWAMLRVVAERATRGFPATIGRDEVAAFVDATNQLVFRIEADIARATNLLHMFQLGLLGLAIAGTIALIYLAFLVIIGPVQRLREGMARMAAADFSVRLPAESRDEFGQLATGFNDMADRLRNLYQSLETRVREKTRSLAERNGELTLLYDAAAFLAEPQSQESMCRGFLERVGQALGADAGAVRFIGSDPPQLHLFATWNLPEDFSGDERCVSIGTCGCGAAAAAEAPIHWRRAAAVEATKDACRKFGLTSMTAVPIRVQGETLGVLNLFYRQERELDLRERQLLATLGQHLGVAVENQRLVAREKEMAVSEERNLLAQELHDSIAQSLAFLNLQVQMLDGAMKREDRKAQSAAAREIATGVRECYADVRELLVHFRTLTSSEDIALALKVTLKKFEQQTGIHAVFEESGHAMPVPAEEQVQILHIVQEALSNARKHAGASEVVLTLRRGPVYTFEVRDNGRGFDAQAAAASEVHVGLAIMRERARRAGATLVVTSRAGQGSCVQLSVPVVPGAPAPQAALASEPV